jgi:hypothetical protein
MDWKYDDLFPGSLFGVGFVRFVLDPIAGYCGLRQYQEQLVPKPAKPEPNRIR